MISRCALSGRRHRIRPPPARWYASTPMRHKKDLPPPLPPKPNNAKVSPAKAKKEYLEAQKKTEEFLKDPQAELRRIQADMDKTKEKLLRVHDKPIWKRVFDRFKAKQHAVINLLAASMAYILAHQLHLKIKANEGLQQEVEDEQAKNSELRKLLRSVQTEAFAQSVVQQATTSTPETSPASSSSWFRSKSLDESALPESNALSTALRQALEAKIGDEGLEDEDRKKKNIRDIWQENETKIENEEGLVELTQAIAVNSQGTNTQSKKRVFDM